MDLRSWSSRLAEHFESLKQARGDIPIFALEHGLSHAEVLALSESVRANVRSSSLVREHPLVWTTYAVEIGYGYSGDEYWQTFEEKTPGWAHYGERAWIRDAFVWFQKKFSGAAPSGAWAKHFSIISWPITHAILPRDLQQQLAYVLYQVRHAFSADLFESPLLLGQFIAAHSWNTSARFQNLVQEPALVGQIAIALLLQGKEGFRTLLHPMTLRRIGDDLDRERRARDWLRGARSAAEQRAKIRGLALGRPNSRQIQRQDEARAEVIRLGIEPRLVLRPVEGSRWEVSLEVPDLSHLLLRFPQFRSVLAESRCTVAGAAGRPMARGRCLHGSQRVALSRWPKSDEVLLKFEGADQQLEYLLRTECLLRPRSWWLFRIASDGMAYESRGAIVRAGRRYLLVSPEALNLRDVAQRVPLVCEGVNAALLDVPDVLTPAWELALRELNLTLGKSIEVWPAGLSAAAWDGEGHGEWTASERPILAIKSDHAIDELTVAVEGGSSLSLPVTGMTIGDPVFIELPLLPVGLHKVSVAARSGTGPRSTVVGDLGIVMRVRENVPWTPGVSTQGPLDVEVDPGVPSLEQVWEGVVAVAVRGPPSRQLKCRVQMFARTGDAPVFERQMPPISLPLSGENWTRQFESHIKQQTRAQHAYDDAQILEVEFSADELGAFTLRCEREFTPLRWSLRRNSSGIFVRLHDNAGSGIPVIERYSFTRPTVGERLLASQEYKVQDAGGLYVATLGSFRASIIVPSVVHSLADLGCHPRVDPLANTCEAVVAALRFVQLWGSARLSGDILVTWRRRDVIRAITQQVFSAIGGQSWLQAERSIGDPGGLAALKRKIATGSYSGAIHARQELHAEALAQTTLPQRVTNLASLALYLRLVVPSPERREVVKSMAASGVRVLRRVRGEGPTDPAWLAEFALRMASDPTSLEAWAGEHLNESINRLLEVPMLARAARFVVLSIDQQKNSLASAGEIYAGWSWSS
jgi:hypothetical protein